MTVYARRIHDALRAQGLVPEVEDVHFLACSTDYRCRMTQAFGDDEDDPVELRRQLEEIREEYLSPDDVSDIRDEHKQEEKRWSEQLAKLDAEITELRGQAIAQGAAE